eukprot:UN19512
MSIYSPSDQNLVDPKRVNFKSRSEEPT